MRKPLAFWLAVSLSLGSVAMAQGRVPIVTDNVVKSLKGPWPMYCGVPLAKGALTDASKARVVDASRAVAPGQTYALARWPKSQSIRWLAVHFMGDPAQRYFVEFGPEVSAAPVGRTRVTVTDEGDHFAVDTGAALFRVGKTGALIREAYLDRNGDGRFDADEVVIANPRGDDLYVVDNEGKRGVVGNDKADGQTRLETPEKIGTPAPVMVCLRREGWYVADDGRKLARHITRVRLYAGKAFARITHTLVLTRDTRKHWLKNYGIMFRHDLKDARDVTFDASHEFDGKTFRTRLEPGVKSLSMFQEKAFFMSRMDPKKDCRFVIRRLGPGGERTLLQGQRCGEWVDLGDGKRGFAVTLRHLWQQYPKELEVTPGAVTVHLWSDRGGRPLDLRSATRRETFPKEWFNAEYHGKGSYGAYYRRELADDSSALGVAKTHELLLDLRKAPPAEARTAVRAHAFCRPVACIAAPEALYRSEAMGPIYPRDTSRFPLAEGFTEAYFDQVMTFINAWGDYGFIDFGSGPHVWYRVPKDGPLKGRWMPYVARYSGQVDYGFHCHLWRVYARSGLRKYLELAEVLNRHRMDICMVHWDGLQPSAPDADPWLKGKLKGAFCGTYSPNYWGSHSITHHQSGTDLRKLYWYYYLRDYRRALDVADSYRAFVKRCWKAGGQAFGTRPFANLRCLATLCEETGDPEVLAIGRARLKALVDLDSPRGVTDKLATGLAKYGTKIGAVTRWYHATGDELAAKSVLRGASTHLHASMGESPFYYFNTSNAYLNLAMRLSGDPAYARLLRRNMEIAITEDYDRDRKTWRPMGRSITSMSNNRVPFGGLALAMDAIRRYPKEATLTPVVQQTGRGRPVFALFRKPARQAVTLDVRSHIPLAPRALTLEGKAVANVGTEAYVGMVAYVGRATNSPFSFRLTLPADAPAGDYLLDPGAGGELWELTWTDADKVVLFAPGGFVTGSGHGWASFPAHRWTPGAAVLAKAVWWHFRVPAEAKAFSIFTSGPVDMIAPDGKPVAIRNTQPAWSEVEVTAANRGKLWRLIADRDTFVRLRGIAPLFAADVPSRYFTPRWRRIDPRALGVELGDETFATPKGRFAAGVGGGKGLVCDGGRLFSFGRGKPVGEGVFGNFNCRRGTLEFWLRPSEATVELPRDRSATRNVLRAGSWNVDLNRGGASNVQLQIDGVAGKVPREHRALAGRPKLYSRAGLTLEKGRWTHLAFQWYRVGTVFHVEAFVDGKLMNIGSARRPAIVRHMNWTPKDISERIVFGRPHPVYTVKGVIDELRVSGVRRYRSDFSPRSATRLEADADTLALFHFEGSLEGATGKPGEVVPGAVGRR